MWSHTETENKIKLNYYKEIINPELKHQNYPSIVFNSRMKIYIAKIKTNSHQRHSDTRNWTRPKML
jgi:hypothetical protein